MSLIPCSMYWKLEMACLAESSMLIQLRLPVMRDGRHRGGSAAETVFLSLTFTPMDRPSISVTEEVTV